MLAGLEWWNTECFLVFVGWMAFQAVLAIVLPGPTAMGVELFPIPGEKKPEKPERLAYKLNGAFPHTLSLAHSLLARSVSAWGMPDSWQLQMCL